MEVCMIEDFIRQHLKSSKKKYDNTRNLSEESRRKGHAITVRGVTYKSIKAVFEAFGIKATNKDIINYVIKKYQCSREAACEYIIRRQELKEWVRNRK